VTELADGLVPALPPTAVIAAVAADDGELLVVVRLMAMMIPASAATPATAARALRFPGRRLAPGV
jgi:hypothetical protein